MRRRIVVRQRDFSDCGPACIVSIAGFYRLQVSVSAIRQYASTDKHGTTVLGLMEAAEKLNFQVKAGKGDSSILEKIPLPAIAHVKLENGLNHYVVIYKVTKKRVTIMDPAIGRIYREDKEDFFKKWTSIVIVLLPSNDFAATGSSKSVLLRLALLSKPLRSQLAQSMACAIIYTVLGLSTSFYVQKIVDNILPENNFRLLNSMSIAMIILLFLQLSAGYLKSLIGIYTGQFLDVHLMHGYYKHLLKLPQSFFDTMRAGEIMSRMNDAVKIRAFINDVAMNILVNILIVGFSVILMFFYYWKLAVTVMLIIPVYFFVYYISNLVNKKWQRKIMEHSANFESQIAESIHSAATIKRFGFEEYNIHKTETRLFNLLQSVRSANFKNLFLGNIGELTTQLSTILLLWRGSYFVIGHEISPGQLLSFYTLAGYFTHPVLALIYMNKSLQDASIAADRLFEIIDLDIEEDSESKIILDEDKIGDIEFRDVGFMYNARTVVFTKLNMRIQRGSTTAIAGESGSGKSTIPGLLQNLYPVKKGSIQINGTNIKYISNESLRKIIGIVPQKIDLFAGTIIENIAPGECRPDLQKIIEICRRLGIDEFVEKLPEGYNTYLHEQGINLSGGQRQRLAIARTLYRDPEILILDEATSSLDPSSEEKVHATLTWFKNPRKTIVIIAHKVRMVKNADTIIVLRNGEVVEEGSHEELCAKNGHYKYLFKEHM